MTSNSLCARTSRLSTLIVYIGPATWRFGFLHSMRGPLPSYLYVSVSADRMTDETTHEPYYLGMVSIDKLQIPEDLRERLRAGMPAEIIAPLVDRSVLSFLTSPLREAWHRSLREE